MINLLILLLLMWPIVSCTGNDKAEVQPPQDLFAAKAQEPRSIPLWKLQSNTYFVEQDLLYKAGSPKLEEQLIQTMKSVLQEKGYVESPHRAHAQLYINLRGSRGQDYGLLSNGQPVNHNEPAGKRRVKVELDFTVYRQNSQKRPVRLSALNAGHRLRKWSRGRDLGYAELN